MRHFLELIINLSIISKFIKSQVISQIIESKILIYNFTFFYILILNQYLFSTQKVKRTAYYLNFINIFISTKNSAKIKEDEFITQDRRYSNYF